MSRRRFFQAFAAVVVTVFLLALCSVSSAQGNSDNAFERVKEVQERHTEALMAKEGVAGTAIGLDEKGGYAVLVLLERPGVPDIPDEAEGVPVRSVVTGKFYALDKPLAKPSKPPRDNTPPAVPGPPVATAVSSNQITVDWPDYVPPVLDLSHYHVYRAITSVGPYIRVADATVSYYSDNVLAPVITYSYVITGVDKSGNESKYSAEASATTRAPTRSATLIGVSTGHPAITAGTIGCRVTKNDKVYALSNNHVYANMNKATIGDNVLQPGTFDGGANPRDAIGVLAEFKPITFSRFANNTIDAAIALCSPETLGCATATYGAPGTMTVAATVGLAVKKQGRTTGLTTGQVSATGATVTVSYGSAGTARFVNQIVITPGTFSAGGDSGSLIVTADDSNNPVGLLFAGSDTHTIANPIQLVLDNFGVTIDNVQ